MHCTPGTLATLRTGEEVRLATSLVVREESLTLFGFVTDDERGTFEMLQTASGVGPKVALAMLAVHTPNALRVAVASADVKALTRVPGVGPKGAQRIIVDLKNKLGTPEEAVNAALDGRVAAPAWRAQVHSGTGRLGYSGAGRRRGGRHRRAAGRRRAGRGPPPAGGGPAQGRAPAR
ncbi:hypothetical protein GCM10018952_72980 [Streptosporangium vulgare]